MILSSSWRAQNIRLVSHEDKEENATPMDGQSGTDQARAGRKQHRIDASDVGGVQRNSVPFFEEKAGQGVVAVSDVGRQGGVDFRQQPGGIHPSVRSRMRSRQWLAPPGGGR